MPARGVNPVSGPAIPQSVPWYTRPCGPGKSVFEPDPRRRKALETMEVHDMSDQPNPPGNPLWELRTSLLTAPPADAPSLVAPGTTVWGALMETGYP